MLLPYMPVRRKGHDDDDDDDEVTDCLTDWLAG